LYYFCHGLTKKSTRNNTIARRRIIAQQPHLRWFFCSFLALSRFWVPFLTKEFALATWFSISSNCSPWDWISTAMSRNTWCNSFRFISNSFIPLCLSFISLMHSSILPLPCSIAISTKFSLSPATINHIHLTHFNCST